MHLGFDFRHMSIIILYMSWKVELTRNALKQLNKLPEQVKIALRLLCARFKTLWTSTRETMAQL